MQLLSVLSLVLLLSNATSFTMSPVKTVIQRPSTARQTRRQRPVVSILRMSSSSQHDNGESPPKESKLLAHHAASTSSAASDTNPTSKVSRKFLRRPGTTALMLTAAVVAAAASPMSAVAATAGSATWDAANTWAVGFAETGFYQAFSLVFLSEIGDKTFFIAGLLAAQTSRFISFVGSMGALAVMTVISVLIGQIFHSVPSGLGEGLPLDDICAVLAFAFFGVKTLKEAFDMEESVMDEELEEAKEEVENTNEKLRDKTVVGTIASIFALVFAAEFGDRSFLSTIALSAAQNPVSVAGGAIAAHAAATGIAVSGGSVLAKYISERVLGIVSGALFLLFAATTALGIF